MNVNQADIWISFYLLEFDMNFRDSFPCILLVRILQILFDSIINLPAKRKDLNNGPGKRSISNLPVKANCSFQVTISISQASSRKRERRVLCMTRKVAEILAKSFRIGAPQKFMDK